MAARAGVAAAAGVGCSGQQQQWQRQRQQQQRRYCRCHVVEGGGRGAPPQASRAKASRAAKGGETGGARILRGGHGCGHVVPTEGPLPRGGAVQDGRWDRLRGGELLDVSVHRGVPRSRGVLQRGGDHGGGAEGAGVRGPPEPQGRPHSAGQHRSDVRGPGGQDGEVVRTLVRERALDRRADDQLGAAEVLRARVQEVRGVLLDHAGGAHLVVPQVRQGHQAVRGDPGDDQASRRHHPVPGHDQVQAHPARSPAHEHPGDHVHGHLLPAGVRGLPHPGQRVVQSLLPLLLPPVRQGVCQGAAEAPHRARAAALAGESACGERRSPCNDGRGGLDKCCVDIGIDASCRSPFW
mmetsp:Transcript_39268/g.97244  ORF Transcript_39268/g.97244 Transcript_39268/m.97244 type:complete len:351 (-) Transcript_39268:154-1206(-)